MLPSMSVQANIKGTFACPSSLFSKKPYLQTSTTPFSVKPRAPPATIILEAKTTPIRRDFKISATAALETAVSAPTQSGAGVKKVGKTKLVLKFVWMEKNIGLALDQEIAGHGTVPLSPYFFWPRKDAWEELKTTLESKPWISQKKMIILLNQATDIINLWQQSGVNISP
ncbi:30S ribosomal protein 3-1, chloroplastic isoform X2 [Ipomoea triloba]|uniref:30S ribosomal protein 3-1, chloroplastic isoform X2 n=1 Tax=Ipomoea triloba TaxID=35885 RepID=UPI00125E3E5A|nr:30S ribosomal protein 3-1, chloroplastic isoform X2 [Ipomoea triloba]